MKLFFVVIGCLLVVAFLSWMTMSLEKIQMHRDNLKHVKEIQQQQQQQPPSH